MGDRHHKLRQPSSLEPTAIAKEKKGTEGNVNHALLGGKHLLRGTDNTLKPHVLEAKDWSIVGGTGWPYPPKQRSVRSHFVPKR